MGKTFKRSGDESEYFRNEKLAREMQKRAKRSKRSYQDEDEDQDSYPKKRK